MQITAVPLFDEAMTVKAYMTRYLKENNLFSTSQATSLFDGASQNEALEIVNNVGLDVFTLGLPLFVPIQDTMLLGNLHQQCKDSADKIIFVFESSPNHDDIYLEKIKFLREKGYRFAINYAFDPLVDDPVVANASYVFLSQRDEKRESATAILSNLGKNYSSLSPIATHIYTEDVLKSLYGKGFSLYESRFYKVAEGQAPAPLPPAKATAIRLMNTVRDDSYAFENIVDLVEGDASLKTAFIDIVNSLYHGTENKIDTMNHAVEMMGEAEVRKWVTTAVSHSLGDDRPNEVIRKSLIRAKFAENLAPLFNLAQKSTELYLMGLCSVLDIMLGMSITEALKMVKVSDVVRDALVNGEGEFGPVLKMVTDYENANWSSVSRHMLMYDIKEAILSEAYIDSLIWYRNLVAQNNVYA